MGSSCAFGLVLVAVKTVLFGRLTKACPVPSGEFNYNPKWECLAIDTGNATRKPSIVVTDCHNKIITTHLGCLTSHQFDYSGSSWNYQVARFMFDNNIGIKKRVLLKGTNALSLIGKNISIDPNGILKVKLNGMPSPYRETRYVGGFVAKRGSNVSPPYGGPGRGIYQYGEAGGAGHGGHGGGDNEPSYGKPYGLNKTDLYLGGSTGAFTGSNLPGIGGPAIELNATGTIEIRGSIEANAIPATHRQDMSAGNSGGLVRLVAERVDISQGATISVKGSNDLCDNNNCKVGGGSGGIVQIISTSGSIAPDVIILSGTRSGYRSAPQDGFLYIKGVKDGHFKTFPNMQFSWGQNTFSTKTSFPSTRTTIQQSTFPRQLSTQITTFNSATPTAILNTITRPSYHGELSTTTSYGPESSKVQSHHTSQSRIGSSSSRQPPHQTMSSKNVSVPPFKKENVENLQQLLEQVKSYKARENKGTYQAEIITQFLESFRTFTIVGDLTTKIINISISLIEELNELMMSEVMSDRHSKLQNQISTLVNTADKLLDSKDAAAWRKSGMVFTGSEHGLFKTVEYGDVLDQRTRPYPLQRSRELKSLHDEEGINSAEQHVGTNCRHLE